MEKTRDGPGRPRLHYRPPRLPPLLATAPGHPTGSGLAGRPSRRRPPGRPSRAGAAPGGSRRSLPRRWWCEARAIDPNPTPGHPTNHAWRLPSCGATGREAHFLVPLSPAARHRASRPGDPPSDEHHTRQTKCNHVSAARRLNRMSGGRGSVRAFLKGRRSHAYNYSYSRSK